MRRLSSLLVLGLALLAFSAGCAAIYHLDEYSAPAKDDASPVPSAAAGDAVKFVDGSTDALRCTRNADCQAGAVCVRLAAKCTPVLSDDCPRVYGDYANDDAILLGTILRPSGGPTQGSLEEAVVLAAEELSSPEAGGGVPPASLHGAVRPLVVVGCDASSKNVLGAARHLVEALHVAAIVGPTAGEDVVSVTQQVTAKGGTLLMTPTSLVSSISQLADNDLTWRDLPADNQRAKLVIQQMNEIESVLDATRSATTVKLAVIHRMDALGLSARDSIAGKLIINGQFLGDASNAPNVSVDGYARASDTLSQSGIATKYAESFRPDIVFLTAAEQVANVVVPLEKALVAARVPTRPYYVCTEAMKSQDFLDAVANAGLPPDIRRRIRGVGVRPDADSAPVLAAFESAFTARYSAPPGTTGAASAYDATMAIAFAIAATTDRPLSGAAVAHGLRTLGVGNSFRVGKADARAIMQSLSAGKSISLRGTSSLMQWDSSGDIVGGTVEVWCVGGSAAAPRFGSSGLTMDVQTQVVGGAFVQCQ